MKTAYSHFTVKTALTQALAQAQTQGSKFFFFLVIALKVAFALQQVKTKYRSGITQAQGFLPHVVVLGQ